MAERSVDDGKIGGDLEIDKKIYRQISMLCYLTLHCHTKNSKTYKRVVYLRNEY